MPQEPPPRDWVAPESVALGRIALKQVRVARSEARDPGVDKAALNRLVPYLDLFGRLEDDELARLADVPPLAVATLRRQVVEIGASLERYVDLLPRLGDDELCRLTGANAKTIRFWRLCQPRAARPASDEGKASEVSLATALQVAAEPEGNAARESIEVASVDDEREDDEPTAFGELDLATTDIEA